jgi:hypothetical protein
VDDRIIELLYRNLQEVFGEGDAARRRAAIENFYAEDCVQAPSSIPPSAGIVTSSFNCSETGVIRLTIGPRWRAGTTGERTADAGRVTDAP